MAAAEQDEAAEEESESQHHWRNWAGNVEFTAAIWHEPRTEERLCQIL